jgi:hypothetical protein
MKNFNKKIYALNRSSKPNCEIPFEYFKMAHNIANSMPKSYSSIGVMNLNDLIQEANYALIKSYNSINWDYINTLETELDKRKATSKYLSKSIGGMLRDEVNKNVDGMKKPIKGIWNNKDKKRVKNGFDYLSILFPQWFDTSTLNMVDEEVYDFDYEKLGEYFDDWLIRHLPKYHLMVKMFFGLDDIFSKPKKISEIAAFFGMPMEACKKQKQRLIKKLKQNSDALDELAYFVATNGIKTNSKAHDYAEDFLKIYRN